MFKHGRGNVNSLIVMVNTRYVFDLPSCEFIQVQSMLEKQSELHPKLKPHLICVKTLFIQSLLFKSKFQYYLEKLRRIERRLR